MNDIFVSYRRSDSSSVVGRVIDRLETWFGKEQIFRDLDSIEYGQNFEEALNRAISGCRVCLVIIGDDWIDVRDEIGNRRIENENDWVRIELSSALEQGVHVIPVLVENAVMPERDQLPDVLKGLSSLHAAKVRNDPDFDIDMERLCGSFERHVPGASTNIEKLLSSTRAILLSGIVLCLVVLIVIFYKDLRRIFEGSRTRSLNVDEYISEASSTCNHPFFMHTTNRNFPVVCW